MLGWATDNRLLALQLVNAIDLAERELRRDRAYLSPALALARLELSAFARGTSATHAAEPNGTNPVPQNGSFVMLSTVNAANTLGISESMTRRLCRTGRLAATKVSGSYRIYPEAIAARQREKSDQ